VTTVDPAMSVVVPSRDRPDALAACLVALEQQTAPSYEVIVVDDASVDAHAVASTVARFSRARLVVADGRGPAAARNRGAEAARAPIVCFTDDDCRPGPQWLDAIARRMGEACVVAGPTRVESDDPIVTASQTVTNHLTESSFDPSRRRVRFAPTSNLSVRADLFRSLPFDERFPLAAGEDREWCGRLVELDVAIEFEPVAWVVHHPDLSLARFWRQQVRYGQGAYRLHRHRGAGDRLQPVGFYTGLVRAGFRHGVRAGALVVLAQFATALGLVRAALADRRAGPESSAGRPG
jgi:glycosyltransferase involved in cell wall biosynthesis